MVGLVIVILLLVIGIYILYTYNNLIKTRKVIDEAFASMDIFFIKRWKCIPKLIEMLKIYPNYEKEIVEELIKLINNEYENLTIKRKLNINNGLSEKIAKLIVIDEIYPELKENKEFMDLIQELRKVENDIAHSKKYYNGIIKIINDKILTFPSNIIAKIFKIEKVSNFEALE